MSHDKKEKTKKNNEDFMEQKISRRKFLGGAAVATATAAVSLAGCSPRIAEDPAAAVSAAASDTVAGNTLSFMIPPQPIPDEDIVETVECDIVVVGGGISGVPAAAIAAELGANVYCLEKLPTIVPTRPTGFSLFGTQKLKDLGVLCTEEDKKMVLNTVWGAGNGFSRIDLIKIWLDQSGAYGDWMIQILEKAGIPVQVGGFYGYYNHIASVKEAQEDMKKTGGRLRDSYWDFFGLQHQVGGSDKCGVALWDSPTDPEADWLTPLYNYAVSNGATFVFNTKAEQLIREDGWETDPTKRVTGVIAINSEGKYVKYLAKNGVILSTGGFDFDAEMVKHYYPLGSRTCRGWQQWMTGDGHKMGMWVGGKMEDPGMYASHMMGSFVPASVFRKKETETMDPFTIVPWTDWTIPANAMAPCLKVNQNGERYFNEEVGYFMSGPIADKQPNGLFWGIWDGEFKNKLKAHELERIMDAEDTDQDMQAYLEKGYLIKADTIDDLINQMNGANWDNGAFDSETFKETLARYNEMCAAGTDSDFYKPAKWMTTVDTPPFYAAEMGSAWITSVGGLEIDRQMRILDTNRKHIPGLYAGGNPAGGFYGCIYANQIPMSLSGRSMTMSWLAAKNALQTS